MNMVVLLTKRQESFLYLVDGEVREMSPAQKIAHSIIGGDVKKVVSEEVVSRWNVKTKKEANQRFWDWSNAEYIKDDSFNSANYFLVYLS